MTTVFHKDNMEKVYANKGGTKHFSLITSGLLDYQVDMLYS